MKEIEEISGPQKISPTEIATDVDVVYSDSAMLKMHMKTPLMKRFTIKVKEGYTEMPKGIFVEFFDDSGNVKNMLRANYAIKYEISKLMEVRYNVVVLNSQGDKLETEHLIWDEIKRRITSDKFVRITTKKEILEGDGLDANEDFTEYEILKPRGSKLLDDKTEK